MIDMEVVYIIGIIALIFAGYFAYRYFSQVRGDVVTDGMTTEVITGSGPASGIEKFVPAQREVVAEPEVHRERVQYTEEVPADPYANQQESAEMPERMRNPERSFRPAPPNTQTPDSGVAGPGPMPGYAQEMVQNEGEFMPGIVAYENDGPAAFSMF
jgi:hypothetical protein